MIRNNLNPTKLLRVSFDNKLSVKRLFLTIICLGLLVGATLLLFKVRGRDTNSHFDNSNIGAASVSQPIESQQSSPFLARPSRYSRRVRNFIAVLEGPDLDKKPGTSLKEDRDERERPEEEDDDDDRNPVGALEFRRLQLQNEKGEIPRDGLRKAREHIESMKAAHEELIKSTKSQGLPIQNINGAGINPNSWEWLGPGNIGGRIRSIIIKPSDPNRMWIGSVSGGIWTTDNGGVSWAPVNDFQSNLAVASMAINPSDSSIMYAGTGEGFNTGDGLQGAGIFKSTNGGASWNQLPATNNANFNFVNRIAVSADGTRVLAATDSGIWLSTDPPNALWNQSSNVQALDIHFLGDSSRAVAGELGTARYSLDGGVTWTLSTFSPPISNDGTLANNGRVELATHSLFGFSSFVYASVNQNGGDIYRSNDSGRTYTRYSTGANYLVSSSDGSIGWYTNTIWSNPLDPDSLIVGGVNLWRGRIDFGTGTIPLQQISDGTDSPHADHHFIVSHPDFNDGTNRIAFFGNDGGFYRCNDVASATKDSGWTKLNNTIGITQFYGAAVHNTSGVVIGGAQDNGTLRFSGNTEGWTEIHGSDGGYVAIDQTTTDAKFFYGEEQRLKVHRSTDGGTTSVLIDTGLLDSTSCLPNTKCSNFIAPLLLDPTSADTLYAGGIRLWRSNDVKAATPTWTSIKDPLPPVGGNNIPISAIAVSPISPNLILVGHNNGDIYRTVTGTFLGGAGTKIDNGLPPRFVTRLVIDVNHSTNWYYATFGGFSPDNIYRSTDNGTTWTDVTGAGATGLPNVPVRSLVINPINSNFLYAGTEIGIFTSEDGGANWNASQDGPANVSVDELFFRADSTLYAATHGRGVYRTSAPVFVPPQVTTTNDSGFGSLRNAIIGTSMVTGTTKKILFNIPSSGVHTITPTTPLPPMDGITIDGWSQGGTSYTGQPLIEINGAFVVTGDGSLANGLIISGGSKVTGLTINRFSGTGIVINPGGGNVVRGCYIGTNAAGTAASGNGTGILINNAPSNTIGRQTFGAEQNLISGNTVGLSITGAGATGNIIRGNYVGTDATGSASVGNVIAGIRITNSPTNTIGGTDPLAGNIISGNGTTGSADGVQITGAAGNMILGNYIGIAANGNSSLNNRGSGINILNAPNTVIGDTTAGGRNVILGFINGNYSVLVQPGCPGTVIAGNYVGLNANGTVALPNNSFTSLRIESADTQIRSNVIANSGACIHLFAATGTIIQTNFIGTNAAGTVGLNVNGTGISLTNGASGNLIGGAQTGLANLISGNFTAISDSGTNTTIQGNFIGTNLAGTSAIPNARGIFIDGGTNHQVGGTAANAGNVISGNGSGGDALAFSNTSNSFVQGNRIGTNAAGTASIPNGVSNGGNGIKVFNSTNITIGGSTASARNIISSNGGNGIVIASGSGTVVQGNYIGTDINGTANFGNGQPTGSAGIEIDSGSHTIGGGNPGEGNIIAFSGCTCFGSQFGSGIRVFSTGNRISGNSIFGNSEVGIDLVGGTETLRVTANDNCDTDSGPNDLQNFPVLASAISSSNGTTVTGSLNSTPNSSFRIEFFSNTACDASGNGEGKTYLGFTTVTTNATCTAPINFTLPIVVPVGEFITTTATSTTNNTSEFSACAPVACGFAASPTSQFFPVSGGNGSFTLVTGGSSCSWNASTTDNWITITSALTGSGNSTVTFQVAQNPVPSARQGTISMNGGAVFRVVQDGGVSDNCRNIITPLFESFPATGGSSSFSINSESRCAWQAVSPVDWVIVTSAAGIGSGTVTYSVLPNPNPTARQATISVGNQGFTVKQKRN